MTLSDLAKYSVTRSVTRSLCDSWASCSRNYGNGTDTGVQWNVFFCFPNVVWASASGAFRIVSGKVVSSDLASVSYLSCSLCFVTLRV